LLLFFFFFQAEDGIRDKLVTGVQTCALPISTSTSAAKTSAESNAVLLRSSARMSLAAMARAKRIASGTGEPLVARQEGLQRPRRSEERRVGKECRSRGARGG